MSTYVYLECLDHDPVLQADGESGQHLSDLPQIRADIANRDAIVAALEDDWTVQDHFRRNTARFLTMHRKCRIGIRDEYGDEHPTTEAEDVPQAAQDAECGSNRRSVGQEDVREAEGVSEEFLASLLKRQERDGFQRDEEKS